jgi:hypothetical protein
VQKSLEQANPTGLRLRGAATIAAAFNPREISLPHAMESDDPLYLAMILAAFSYVYDEPLDGLVQQPYKDQLADWFDGSHDQEFLQAHLPPHVDELLTAEFLQDYAAGEETPHWFYDALEQAGTYAYAPRAPLRIHFGSKDTVVIPAEAHAAFSHMQAVGGNVELVDVGAYDHDEIALHSLPLIQRWFDSLERSNR